MTSGTGQEKGGQALHRSVLLDSAVDYLRYIDGTFGRGGHSRLILDRLGPEGRLLGIDKDPEAIRFAGELAADDARFALFHGSFAELEKAASEQGWHGVNGVLLDLGVSSPQLDDASRGFSFMRQGPLDMRMNPQQAPSAAEWLATAGEQEIADVIWRYGEERFSRRIALEISGLKKIKLLSSARKHHLPRPGSWLSWSRQRSRKKKSTSIRQPGPSRRSGSLSIVNSRILKPGLRLPSIICCPVAGWS